MTAALAPMRSALHGLRSLHSGHVGDYVVWLLVGAAGGAALILVPG